jgi:hypothetical protein
MKDGKKYQIYTYIEDQDMENPISNFVEESVLLEFKCPFTRAPGPLNDTYLYQVLGGISLSEEAGIQNGLFVDAKFRKCALEDLKFNNTNIDISYPDGTNSYYRGSESQLFPIAMGIIYVYGEEQDEAYKPIDFGDKTPNFSSILRNIDNTEYNTVLGDIYLPKIYDSQPEQVIGLDSKLLTPSCIGYIPYKLLSVYYTLKEKDRYLLDRIIFSVNEAIEEINKINSEGIL